MDWYAVGAAFDVAAGISGWAFAPGCAGWVMWRWSARGTWQRLLGRRLMLWMIPFIIASLCFSGLRFIILGEKLQAGLSIFYVLMYVYIYWDLKRDDDDDDWRKLKKRVRARLRRRVRALRPAWNPS